MSRPSIGWERRSVTGKRLLQKAKAFLGQARFAGLAGCNFSFEKCLQLGKRAFELVDGARQLACLANAADRIFEDVDGCSHGGQQAGPSLVP
jgi:hypothetical protein